MNIHTTRIRKLYPDFVKQLRVSTKDFVEHHFNFKALSEIDDELVDTHLQFLKSCYYDDVRELEKIIFFTSSPFYEFSQVYENIICPIYKSLKYVFKSKDSDWDEIFWREYESLLESEFYKIKFDDSKFYFRDCLVPTNPYEENQINMVVFDFVTEVDKFIKKNREKHPKESSWRIFSWLMNDDFVKNHDFDERHYYCYEITN